MYRQSAILLARLIYVGVFGMAAWFKFAGMPATATMIAGAGFPMPLALAWVAALFELGLVVAFLTGLYYRQPRCPPPLMSCSWPSHSMASRTGPAT